RQRIGTALAGQVEAGQAFAGADLQSAGVLFAGDAHRLAIRVDRVAVGAVRGREEIAAQAVELREIVAVAERAGGGEADVDPLHGVVRVAGVEAELGDARRDPARSDAGSGLVPAAAAFGHQGNPVGGIAARGQ